MPIYEFVCKECGCSFEELVRSGDGTEISASCPLCHSLEVKKKLSTFATKISGGAFTTGISPASSCNSGRT